MAKRVTYPAIVLMQAAGLIATGYVVWVGAVAPRLKFESPGAIVLSAFVYAGLAWAFSAGLTLLLCAAFLGWNAEAAFRMSLRTSRTAVWFAPACILVSHLSPAALIPALALVFGTTQLLYTEWVSAQPPAPAPPPSSRGSFEPIPSPPFLRTMALPVIAALVFQASVTAQSMRYPLLAAAFFSMGVALATLLLLNGGVMKAEQSTTLPKAIFGVLLTFVLAAGLTAVHVIVRQYKGLPGWGGGAENVASSRNPFDSIRELMRQLLPGDDGNADEAEAEKARAQGAGIVPVTDDVFPGIVLVSEAKSYATLVAPSPSWLKASVASIASQSYSIPFSGEYWMFRGPHTRPPRGARYQAGNPADLSFKTNDRSPMKMEARQKLDRNLPLSCCGAIRVQVANADRFPGTISLELELIERLSAGESSVSLGRLALTEWPVVSRFEGPERPVYESLEFPIPPSAAIQQFNEFRLILHRDMVRSDRSARVSIERFTLVPRR